LENHWKRILEFFGDYWKIIGKFFQWYWNYIYFCGMLKYAGIYRIDSKVLSACCYVGQSINIKARLACHKRSLINGTHFNKGLTNHVKKYGYEDLIFSLICRSEEEKLYVDELYYIGLLNPLYNRQCVGRYYSHKDEVIMAMRMFVKKVFADYRLQKDKDYEENKKREERRAESPYRRGPHVKY
jgi:hypothetical protein